MISESDKLIRLNDVQNLVGFKKTKIYRMMSMGDFPKNIKDDAGSKNSISLWSHNEVQIWIKSKLENKNKGI